MGAIYRFVDEQGTDWRVFARNGFAYAGEDPLAVRGSVEFTCETELRRVSRAMDVEDLSEQELRSLFARATRYTRAGKLIE